MANPVKIGLECKGYYLSTGTRASWGSTSGGITTGAAPANLVEAKVIKNVTLTLSASEADVSSRASIWKLVRKALRDMSPELEIPWNPTDPVFVALLSVYMDPASAGIAMVFLDGADTITGSQGPWADFDVTEFTREEPLEGAVMAKVKLVPTSSTVPPEWVQVS